MNTTSLSFKYELEKKAPRSNDGGTTRGASVIDFPASIGIAGVFTDCSYTIIAYLFIIDINLKF